MKDIFSGVSGGTSGGASTDIFGSKQSSSNDNDMFAFFNGAGASAASSDPFGGSSKPADPFASTKSDPFASAKADPFSNSGTGDSSRTGGLNDLFGKPSTQTADPFASMGITKPAAGSTQSSDPFAGAQNQVS